MIIILPPLLLFVLFSFIFWQKQLSLHLVICKFSEKLKENTFYINFRLRKLLKYLQYVLLCCLIFLFCLPHPKRNIQHKLIIYYITKNKSKPKNPHTTTSTTTSTNNNVFELTFWRVADMVFVKQHLFVRCKKGGTVLKF